MTGERRRGPIGGWMMLLAAAALLAGLAGCDLAPPDQDPQQNPSPEQSRSGGTGEDTATDAGPIDLATPIEFLLVQEVVDAPCPDDFVADREDQECFRLGDGMEITEVIELELGAATTPDGVDSGEVLVNLTMIDEDGEAFADLTSEALATDTLRVAMVVEDEVVAAPQVAHQIHGGELQISAWDGAREFVAEATAG